jgi:HAD superfamily hydrolase (TIGR01549 family)
VGRKISRRKKEIFMQRYLASLKAFPHVRDLIQTLQEKGIQVGVASSAQSSELKQILKKVGIDDLIEVATSADEVKRSKPSPDIVQSALNKLNLPSHQVLMVGDTPYDIQSAHQLGVITIALRCGGWTDSELQQAVKIYQNPQDLFEQIEQSPFFWSENQLNQTTLG